MPCVVCYAAATTTVFFCSIRNIYFQHCIWCHKLFSDPLVVCCCLVFCPNNLHNLTYLVSSIFWTVSDVSCLSTSGNTYSLILCALVGFFHCAPVLPLHWLFAMVLGTVCVPFLLKLSQHTLLPAPCCTMSPTQTLLLTQCHAWLFPDTLVSSDKKKCPPAVLLAFGSLR